jgi:phage gpG-like protein
VSGQIVRIDLQDAEFQGTMRQIAGRMTLKNAWPRIGRTALAALKQAFQEQVDPDDSPWAELTPAYAARKQREVGDKQILHYSEALFDSLAWRPEGEGVVVGSLAGPPWAAIHNWGGETHNAVIPRREYVGLRQSEIDALEYAVVWYIATGDWTGAGA